MVTTFLIWLLKEDIINEEEYLKANYESWSYGQQETVEHLPPIGCEDIPEELSKRTNETFATSQPWVAEVQDTILIGPKATLITNDGKIFIDPVIKERFFKDVIFEMMTDVGWASFILATLKSRVTDQSIRSAFSMQNHLSIACSSMNHWIIGRNGSPHYAHWLLDFLIRSDGLLEYEKRTESDIKLVIPNDPPDWLLDSVHALGYEASDLIRWDSIPRAVGTLVYPSYRRDQVIAPSACRNLRRQVVENLQETTSKTVEYSPYILITRRNAENRRLLNEDEVANALAKFGFVPYALDELSFKEQVELFSQAEMIVGPTGAGFINMIWAEDATVIELLCGSCVQTLWYSLASSLDFEYGFLTCNPQGETILAEDREEFVDCNKDLVVDTERITNIVERLID